MLLNNHFWQQLKECLKIGDKVAELYHGEKDDILRGIAEIVSDEGIVYGVDNLNPFERHANMQELQRLSNVRLLKASIPPFPKEVVDLDAIIIREFIWAYPLPYDGKENPETYRAIDAGLNEGGYLILCLNETEQETERGKYPIYNDTIMRQLPGFIKVYDNRDLFIWQKRSSRKS